MAEDGLQAVIAATSNTYDLILMDVQMPNLTGLAATAKIREYESISGKRTPIIALTTSDREECIEAGMDDHLTKPARFSQLNTMISSYLSKSCSEVPPSNRVPSTVSNFYGNTENPLISQSAPNLTAFVNGLPTNKTVEATTQPDECAAETISSMSSANSLANSNNSSSMGLARSFDNSVTMSPLASIEFRKDYVTKELTMSRQTYTATCKLYCPNQTNNIVLGEHIDKINHYSRTHSDPCFFLQYHK
eukprot:gene10725-12484_t